PDDLRAEVLFNDPVVIAAGVRSRWARMRKITLPDLVNEPWMLSPPGTWNYDRLAEAFKAEGLTMPKPKLITYSTSLVGHFLARGTFITAYSRSVVRVLSLKELPITLPARPWPVAVVTLKNRNLSPVVDRFVECAREVTRLSRRAHNRR